MANKHGLDLATLQAALVGYEQQILDMQTKVAAIQRQLGGRAAKASTDVAPRTRRKLSAAARKRIAAAQKKRWAAFRKAKRQ